MNRKELIDYIDNNTLLGNIITKDSPTYKSLDYPANDVIIGSVEVDGLFLKKDTKNRIHLTYYNGDYEELDLGDCVDIIDARAFFINGYKRNKNICRAKLKHVSGSKVKSIGSYSFANSKIKSCSFPNLTHIGTRAFMGSSIEAITFNKVKHIPNGSFKWANNLRSFKGNNVESVASWTFCSCESLRSIIIPSAKIIKLCAFSDCKNLRIAEVSKDCKIYDTMVNKILEK